jgi:hypothetical protein
LITGIPPFNGDSPSETFARIITRRIDWSD